MVVLIELLELAGWRISDGGWPDSIHLYTLMLIDGII